ncbi:MAG TPA: PEP/pyruvate-binding domain-containing protein, partial [Vicinamibacteria bacterium]|nr:PEP/pyruvate-binding domain-containing protein [Vicinamibacteria bacterium]
MGKYVQRLGDVGMSDLGSVGGKNASLGEMLRKLTSVGVLVPDGFATTTQAFHAFIESAGLEERLREKLSGLDVEDVSALTRAGREIRAAILEAKLPEDLSFEVREAYRALSGGAGGNSERSFAVRSSATAEDMPDASFAGQQETFLNVRGEENVLQAVKSVFASLFNDRAIAYRVHQGFRDQEIGISAGVQLMVRSDLAASGVAFTLDTESGFRDVVFVTGSYGLGESIVQGAVNPDEFYLYKRNLVAGRPAVLSRTRGEKATKMVYDDSSTFGAGIQTVPVPEEERGRFVLSDAELEELGRQAIRIETHYGRPMDIEWAKDGLDGRIYVVQARPETVKSRDTRVIERYRLRARGEVLVEGRAVGQKIAAGPARLIKDVERMGEL